MRRVRLNNVLSAFVVCPLLATMLLAGCGQTEDSSNSVPANSDGKLAQSAAVPGSESADDASQPSETGEVVFQSGMEIGGVPLPFDVMDVTGPNRGKHLCYRCLYGGRPVVGIFVRELDENAKALIWKIDQEVAAHQAEKLAAFVVVLTEDPQSVKSELEKVAVENKIKHVPLTVFAGAAGPEGYQVAREATVNVMLWEGTVKANRAYRKGQLNDAGIQEVIADTRLVVN